MMPLRALGKSFFLVLLLSFPDLFAASAPVTLSITTFNIRMFGFRNDSEIRDPEIKKFINESIPYSDIMVFEEIMDLPRFKRILPENWSCVSYDHSTPHQFVLLCHSPRFNFKREPTDDNDIIDEVGGVKRTLRPAVTAIVTDEQGKNLFRIIAVHLKALPDYTRTRLDQTEIIARYLNKVQDPALPVVITGDFNTYKSQMNGQSENDVDLIAKKFNELNLKIDPVHNTSFTYRTSYGRSQFDQFYISSSLRSTKPLKVFEICNSETEGEGTMNLEYYNKMISDHCPVTAEIAF